MSKENILKDSYPSKNTLHISVTNIDELDLLIKDVKEKEKALQEAVHKLSNYELKVKFD